ncbi:YqaA family protein [Asticcacaulis sp. EMRT-3]|uniref:YqaA family protein n=1 Tax=Asticcacaulis sp. EMRT-3 TaxID=3040349 RepID=UPI0024AEAAAC|nr:YqaA family protein [Asticcacaulis sp. EMRT-3]MDI7774024.1 YqaA family protein [Asticcacaulis sp. EMRT-3]
MLRPLYNWMIRLARGPYAETALAVIAFAEASFFPLPPDVMLAPLVLAKPEKAWRLAAICSVFSVLGGFLGYAIGYYVQPLGHWILALFGHPNGLAEFHRFFNKWGVWVILIKGLTPIPYKLVTIAAGLAQFSLLWFAISSAITRTTRFFLVAFLFKRFGPEITAVIEKRIYLVSAIVLAVTVLGFVIVKLMAK